MQTTMLDLLTLEGRTALPDTLRRDMASVRIRCPDPSLPVRLRVSLAGDWCFCHTDGRGHLEVEWQSLGSIALYEGLLIAGSGAMSLNPASLGEATLVGHAILCKPQELAPRLSLRGGISHHLVMIPGGLITDEALFHRPMPLYRGPAMLLAAMVRTLELQLSAGDDDNFEAIAPLLLGLIEASFGARFPAEEKTPERRRRAAVLLDHLAANLEDPDLSPQRCAAACGLSVRQLHRLLHDQGESFATIVRRMRLERAAMLLRLRRSRRIADIAADAGFSTPAHFATLFRAAYGLSPRDWRRREIAPGGS